MENLTALFFHSGLTAPITLEVFSKKKFFDLCEEFPTDWAHLMNSRTGEIVSSWSNEDVSRR